MSRSASWMVTASAACIVAVTSGAAGCGGSGGDSTFADPNGGQHLGGDGDAGGALGNGGSVGSPGSVTPGSACATSSAGADAIGANLVFMVDRSGSMGRDQMAVRWQPATSALESFFSSPSSKGMSASIQFFSQPIDECNAAGYATPAVAMRPLPEASAFQTVISTTFPNGGTPTIAAIKGAITYAQSVQKQIKAGQKVAIVLVTDGDPNDCAANPKDVTAAAAEVAAAAQTVAATIPTYVIGVGPDAQNLNAIAKGGGTGQAIMVSTGDPTKTTNDLVKALGQIQAQTLGCEYTLPTPPAGQTLDVNAVNVNYTPAGGAAQTLPYSADCSNGGGWHYDNVVAPTKVMLCTSICSTAKASSGTGAKLDVVFGCKTQGGVVR